MKPRKAHLSEAGFTLVQALVVIALIGILAGIAIPFYGNLRDKPKLAQALMEVRNLQGLAIYHVNEEGYVPSIQQLADMRSRSDSHIIGNYLIFSLMDGFDLLNPPASGYVPERFVVCSIWDIPGADYVYGLDDKPPRIARDGKDPLGAGTICGSEGSGDVQPTPLDCDGCDIDAACPCNGNWRNHGEYVSCVAHAVRRCIDAGLIARYCTGRLVRGAAQSGCGQR